MIRPLAASVLGAVAFAALGVAGWALLIVPGAPRPTDNVVFGVVGAFTVAVGVVIAWRERTNIVGVYVVILGTLEIGLVARAAWYWVSFARPDALARPSALLLALNSNLGAVVFFVMVVLILVFPSGRLPSPRWRWLVGGFGAATAALVLSGLFVTTANFPPYDHMTPWVTEPTPAETAFTIGAIALFFGALLAGVAGAVIRLRRVRGLERTQLRWVLLGLSLFLFFPFVCGFEILLTGSPQWASLTVAYLGMGLFPVGVAIGMLKYDLFDVDRALASTVTWAFVATALQLVFLAAIAVGGGLVGAGSPWPAAAATAVCAVALIPVHRLIERWIGRALYPQRRAALQAIARTEQRVNAGVGMPEELEEALRVAVHDPTVRLGYVLPETGQIVDASGESVAGSGATPIEAGGERIGVLVAPSLTSGLRRELADASVMLVNIARLRLHLSRSLEEVEASRSRIIAAEDHARRRFERDLHDGAQQRLVSLGMTLRRAQRRLPSGDVDVTGLIDEAVAELGTATSELRRLAHGIRPSVLDDGLAAAVTSLTRTVPLSVALDLAEEPVPEPAATTAYFLVAESLTNAVKHAGAQNIAVTLDHAGESIRVAVTDDGCGGADSALGTGLSGLRDRVAAVGGRLRLVSEPGRGTTVEAVLPCGS